MNSASPAQDIDSAEQVFQNALIAAGGPEAFQKIRNFRIVSKTEVTGNQSVIKMTVTETIQLPDKTKQVFELEQGTRIQTLDGGAGWKMLEGQVFDLSETEKLEMQRGLFRDLIIVFQNYENAGLEINLLGTETVAGKSNYALQIKGPGGDFFNLYIDSELFLVSKKSYFGKSAAGPATLEEIYSDYRKVSGIMIPFHTVVRANGKKFIQSDVTETDVNLELTTDFFYKN